MTRLLVISDVHSNFTALEAVLKDAEQYGPFDAKLCAGDIVGYGPQPNECIKLVRDNFFTVAGNHDKTLIQGTRHLRTETGFTLQSNDRELDEENREYLKSLPGILVEREFNFGLVHGCFTRDADKCINTYVYAPEIEGETSRLLAKSMRGLNDREVAFGFFGHTHLPTIAYGFVPASDDFNGIAQVHARKAEKSSSAVRKTYRVDIPESETAWTCLVNPGSVGQPRNGCPHATYAVIDMQLSMTMITIQEVPYDITSTQQLMHQKGFDKRLIDRLAVGE